MQAILKGKKCTEKHSIYLKAIHPRCVWNFDRKTSCKPSNKTCILYMKKQMSCLTDCNLVMFWVECPFFSILPCSFDYLFISFILPFLLPFLLCFMFFLLQLPLCLYSHPFWSYCPFAVTYLSHKHKISAYSFPALCCSKFSWNNHQFRISFFPDLHSHLNNPLPWASHLIYCLSQSYMYPPALVRE